MKRTIIVLFALVALVFSASAMAKEITVKCEWQPNTETDLKQYVVYHRAAGQGYDYDIPVKIIPAPTVTADIKFNVADGQLVTNHLVIRAEDTGQNQSGDSNEVSAIIDLRTPSAPITFAAVYNDVTETIDFTWGQADPELVSRWKLFMSPSSGGTFAQVGSDIINDTSTWTASWQVPSDGDYYFKLVGFRDGSDVVTADGLQLTSIDASYSPDSAEVYAQVKIHPSPVKTFKVKLRVYQ